MAYLSFSPLEGETRTATGPATTTSPTASDVSLFSSTELRVIGFAERVDATRELAHESRLGRFAEWALGMRLGRPLADPRLESLRRFASLAKHHADVIGEEDIQSLIAAGYSPSQAYGLLGYLSGGDRPHSV